MSVLLNDPLEFTALVEVWRARYVAPSQLKVIFFSVMLYPKPYFQ